MKERNEDMKKWSIKIIRENTEEKQQQRQQQQLKAAMLKRKQIERPSIGPNAESWLVYANKSRARSCQLHSVCVL